MENLSKIKNTICLLLFTIGFGLFSSAQKSNLFILKFDGQPSLIYSDTTEVATVGAVIDKKTKLVMKRDDVVHIINNKGDVFELYNTGTFKYKDLEKLKPKEANNNYGRNVMLWFWSEFTNSLTAGYSKSGVVYRGDYVKLMQPMDSISIYANEIHFEWENKPDKTKPYYFVLREIGTDKTTKIGTQNNSISLFIDDIILHYGKQYEWSVVESKYENLNKVEFSSFTLLSESEYNQKQEEYKALYQFLKTLGYEESEAKTIFCQRYKTCL